MEMITLYGQNFSWLQFILWVWVFVWGFSFGVKNLFVRIKCLFTVATLRQNTLGIILDSVWIFSLFVLGGTYYGN